MPIYEYKCAGCGNMDEVFQHIHDDAFIICPRCRQPKYHRIVSSFNTDIKEFAVPIELQSIACTSQDQIDDFRKKCPNVEMSTDPNHHLFGVPVARTRRQKLDALAAVGFEEKN